MENCSSQSCGSNKIASSCPSQTQETKQPGSDEAIKETLDKIKNKLMIMSGKGGVGKTSTTINLGMALADKGFKVGILDVDIHGPDIPRMLGITDMLELTEDKKLAPLTYSDNLKAVSIEALSVNKDDAIIWRGPMKYSAINQFIGEVKWGKLDYLLIDSPPGTGDEPLTVAQKIADAKAVIVTTPQEISLADVRKSINFCKTVKMGILGLIENMSGCVCPHCNETIQLFGTGGGEKTAADAKIDFLGRIPFDGNMVKCGDAGTSFLKKYPDSLMAKAFLEVAQKIIDNIK
ncbi:MAG: Mrp/NBP35 family ATP-binding protein [Deltaproteobacteria bacterium]|nr:Mrp/NBP35 family ATP-binding protein [Deltaproteobacteria bacterium]